MKIISKFLFLSLAFIAFSVSSVSAQQSGGNVLSGAALEQRIFKKILSLPRYGVFDHITFQVNGGNVTLGGDVVTLGTKRNAADAVKRIPGVTNVVNNINDLPPSSFDDSIRRRALRTFADKGLYRYLAEPNPGVRIIVEGGRLTLEGYVANSGDSNLFNIYARGLSNVFEVTNNLVIGRDRNR